MVYQQTDCTVILTTLFRLIDHQEFNNIHFILTGQSGRILIISPLNENRLHITKRVLEREGVFKRQFLITEWREGLGHSGETLLCAPPRLIAICCPYLEPARFARQNLYGKIPFYLAQI